MPPTSLRSAVAPLAVAHVAGVLAQLLTFPYLARALGPTEWAPILLAQALFAWAALLVEHGADLHGPRVIAALRARNAPLGTTIWGIQGAKLTALPVVLALLAIIMRTLPAMHEHRGLLGWTLLAAAARGASPLWYFQGVERAPRAMGIDAGARIIGAIAVLPFVTNPGHGWRVIAAQAIVNTVAAVWLTIEMARAHPFSRSGFAEAAREARRQSRSLYAQRIAMTLFLNANPVILGFFAPWAPLAAYASAERLLRSLNNILAPLSQVLVPRASALEATNPNAAGSYAKFLLPRVTGLAILIASLIAATAPLIIRAVLGADYEAAVPLLRWFAPLLPIVAASTVLSSTWAIPTGKDTLVLRTTVAAACTLLLISVAAVPVWGAAAMVWATLAAELVVLILLSATLWRRTP